jgi:hypothetical protein
MGFSVWGQQNRREPTTREDLLSPPGQFVTSYSER